MDASPAGPTLQSDFGKEYDSICDMVALRRLARPSSCISGASAHLRLQQVLGPVRLARLLSSMRSPQPCAWPASMPLPPLPTSAYFEGLPSPSAAAAVAGFIWLVSEFPVTGLPALALAFAITICIGALMVSKFLLLERQGAEHAGPHPVGVRGADPIDLRARSRWRRSRCSPCSGSMQPPRRCTGCSAN